MSSERNINIDPGEKGIVITVTDINTHQESYGDLTEAKLKIGVSYFGNGCLGITGFLGSLGLIAMGGVNIITGLRSGNGGSLLYGVGAFSVGGVTLLSTRSFLGKAVENYQVLDEIEKQVVKDLNIDIR